MARKRERAAAASSALRRASWAATVRARSRVSSRRRSTPDGYTLVLGHIGTFGVGPSLYAKLPYDPVRDFAPIGLFGGVSNLLVVHPSLPATSLKSLISFARSRPGQLNYGSAGVGSA